MFLLLLLLFFYNMLYFIYVFLLSVPLFLLNVVAVAAYTQNSLVWCFFVILLGIYNSV